MLIKSLVGCAAASAIAAFISVAPAQAGMYPTLQRDQVPSIQHVDCAVGFHIGPAGACVLGVPDDPPPPPVVVERPGVVEHPGVVIEHRSVDEGCQTKSIHREDAMGNSETKTKSNCD